MSKNPTPSQLIARLGIYYAVFLTAVIVMLLANAELLRYMPFGGTDALDRADFEVTETSIRMPRELLDTSIPTREITPELIATSTEACFRGPRAYLGRVAGDRARSSEPRGRPWIQRRRDPR